MPIDTLKLSSLSRHFERGVRILLQLQPNTCLLKVQLAHPEYTVKLGGRHRDIYD